MCFSRARTRYYWIFAIASRCYVTRASDPVELTAFDLLNQMVEGFQSSWHAQTDQVAADPLDRGIRGELARHGPAPTPARRRATAS